MIVVTAPTSRIGTHIVSELLDAGASLRLVARDPSRLAPSVLERAEVVEGSHGHPKVVDAAFRGAEALFWLVPADPKADSVMAAYVDFSRPAVAAMASLGVRRVVSVSALGRATPLADQAGNVTASLAMDDLIADTGVALRALVMPSFMDNILWQVASIRDQGLFFSPISGDLRLPSCATRDIAAVAARLLLDSTWSGQAETAVLGPEHLSLNDMALIMSDVLGRPVRFQQIPLDAYKARFLAGGMSEAMAQAMTDMANAKDKGLDLGVQRTAKNTTPTSFRQWCGDVLLPAVQGSGERPSSGS